MRTISLLLLAATLAGAQTGPREVMSGNVLLSNGVYIQYSSRLTGRAPNCCGGGVARDKDNVVHRVVTDPKTAAYFGYDLAARPLGGNAIEVSFLPLTNADELARQVLKDGRAHPMPLPAYPAPQTIHSGDTIALDLMGSGDGQATLTDYLQISYKALEPGAAAFPEPARDYTVDDPPVRFRQGGVEVFVNGQRYSGTPEFEVRPGSTFWLAVPGFGRYILSLAPHAGFALEGELRDNTIRFRTVEIRTRQPIVNGAFNLYVFHDASYRPKPGEEKFIRGGVDRLENLLPR